MIGWKNQVRDRLIVVFYVVILLFLIIGYRLISLQIFQHDLYKSKAESQHKGTITIPALRGSIMDRKYVVLANSLALTSITADPTLIKDRHKTAVLLSQILGDSEETAVNVPAWYIFTARLRQTQRFQKKLPLLCRYTIILRHGYGKLQVIIGFCRNRAALQLFTAR